jgi:hypothetical protein
MTEFNPEKLHVTFEPPTTSFSPIQGRKYTLTHSDETGELFLAVGKRYDLDAIDQKLRDEVLAEWKTRNGEYVLMGKVHISTGEFDEKLAKIRYMIFKKEMNLALTGMVYGDREFYVHNPWLLDSPILVHFESVYPEFNEVLYFGTPRYYLASAAARRVATRTQV